MRKSLSLIFHLAGLLLSVGAPAAATLAYFPLWHKMGESYVLSGVVVLLLCVCAIPLLRLVKSLLRSPTAYVIWLIVFLAFLAISRVADEITVIAFVGFIGNLAGTVLFALAGRGRHDEKLR